MTPEVPRTTRETSDFLCRRYLAGELASTQMSSGY